MNRREFCRLLALTAPGVVLAEQVDALQRTYLLSAPQVREGLLVGVHDIYLSFDCQPYDGTALIQFFDRDRLLLPLAMNIRTSMRMALSPGDYIMTSTDRFHWTAIERRGEQFGGDLDLTDKLCGYVGWTDDDGKQQRTPLQHRNRLREDILLTI